MEFDPCWICPAQSAKRHQEIDYTFSFMNSSGQAIRVNVIESQELLRSRTPSVGCPEPVRMLAPCPMRPVNGFDLQRTPLVKANNGTTLWNFLVKLKNAVFFSQTPDRETASRSLSVVRKGLPDAKVSGSIHCSHWATSPWICSSRPI